MSFDVWAGDLPRIEVYGTDGSLSVPDPNGFDGPVRLFSAGAGRWENVPVQGGYGGADRGYGIADLARARATGTPHRASGQLAYHILEIMESLLNASGGRRRTSGTDPLRLRCQNGAAQAGALRGRAKGRPPERGRAAVADKNEDAAQDSERAAQGGGPASVTIAYIAKSAGVSAPTVSKVLNGRSGVSDETRARVEELINKYGYRRPPGNRRQKIVELVFRELESMWGVEILRGVEEVASKNRIGVMVSKFGLHDSKAALDGTAGRRPECVLSVSQLSEANATAWRRTASRTSSSIRSTTSPTVSRMSAPPTSRAASPRHAI